MGRKAKADPVSQFIAAAVTRNELSRLDAAVVAARRACPETAWTRSTLLRALLLAHLEGGKVPAPPPPAV